MAATEFRRDLFDLVNEYAEKGAKDPALAQDLDLATYIIHFSLWREGGQSRKEMLKALAIERPWHKRKASH
jgi:hypothetical protein